MSSSILVVHEQASVRAEARRCLEDAGHRVAESSGLDPAAAASPDLLLVDHAALYPLAESLPRIKRHENTAGSRLIVLAPRDSLAEAYKALELGADDCLGVPIEAHELAARVAATLRRPPARLEPESLAVGPVEIDRARHRVRVHDRPVDLAPTEFRLMAFFLENPGRVFSRAELLRRAWGKHIRAGQRTVDVHVRRLRQQLEPFGCEDMIQTVRGFGYRFSVDAAEARRDVDGFAVDECL
jgi:two-component system phosphate regulon response regulator PhoB